MNNFKEVRLTNYPVGSKIAARFRDGSDNVRRYCDISPSSVRRLQNAVREGVHNGEFEIRVPHNFTEVGWVADRR